MTKLLLLLLLLLIVFAAFLFFKARSSADHSATQIAANALPDCPHKPNCVSSTVDASDTHYIEALTAPDIAMESLQQVVTGDGGTIVQVSDQLLVATYKSALFGFVDDLLLLRNHGKIDVYSASRVGYSDFNANRKRVERLRKKLSSTRN